MVLENFLSRFKQASRASFSSGRRTALTLLLSGIFYILLILSGFPEYSWQMLSANIFYLDEALVALTLNTVKTAGYAGVATTSLYSLFIGMAFTNFGLSLRMNGVKSFADLGAALPGFLATGCAGCGAGLLGLIGLGGALAMLPFNGNGVRILGILLILYFMGRSGDPETCSIAV